MSKTFPFIWLITDPSSKIKKSKKKLPFFCLSLLKRLIRKFGGSVKAPKIWSKTHKGRTLPKTHYQDERFSLQLQEILLSLHIKALKISSV